MVLNDGMGDDFQRQRAAMAGRMARRESDTRRDLERMHLMTIRREKMRLQQELEKVRVKGQHTFGKRQVNNAGKNAKFLSNRFGMGTSESSGDDPRRRTRLGTASSDRRVVSPNCVRRNISTAGHSDRGLPQIGFSATPLKGELEIRRQKDEKRDPNTKLNELKMNEGRQKNLLSLKVDQFTRSLTPVSPGRSPARSPAQSPPLGLEEKSLELEGMDAFTTYSGSKKEAGVDLRATFPPPNRKKGYRMSIADYDVTDAKHSISKRLISLESSEDITVGFDQVMNANRHDEILPQISPPAPAPAPALPHRPSVIRRQSQVAILERSKTKTNKYAPSNDSSPADNSNNYSQATPKRSTVESELSLAVLGRDAKRVKEIIENPEIVFDQEKYAPDGALRTVHMLPDANRAYSQARQARYLRWRDPNEIDLDQELSVNDIFSKGKVN